METSLHAYKRSWCLSDYKKANLMSKHLSHSQCQRAVSRHTTGWSRTFSQIGGIIVWKYPFMHTNGTEEYNIINEKTSNSRVLSVVSGLESNVREHLAH
jgi:uncharacterized protein (DUF934 family)